MFKQIAEFFRPKHPTKTFLGLPKKGPQPNRHVWWRQYLEVESRQPRQPSPNDMPAPRLTPGASIRLKGKPDRIRAVLKVEWHRHRYQYVYVVETSARTLFEPYWFADQLEVQPVTEDQGIET